MESASLSVLEGLALEAAERSLVPYSRRSEAAVLLLSDGSWIPGVRVESASFSLTIHPLLNALTTAVAAARTDIAAVMTSRPLQPREVAFAEEAPFLRRLTRTRADVIRQMDVDLPSPGQRLSPYVFEGDSLDADEAIRLARTLASRAHVPDSDFPVACILEIPTGRYVPGVNVEHPDWSHILCAERNALGTCVSYGLDELSALFLTCLMDPNGTPCGACRQLLVELAPTAALWMDRDDRPPTCTDPITLLPDSFSDEHLTSKY